MAHELDITNGIASFADSKVRADGTVDAWHRLGTPVGHTMTASEALEAAHMNGWDVRTIPLRALSSPTRWVAVEGKNLVLRTNPVTSEAEPLGVVGDRWTPCQNEQSTKLLSDITDESGAHIETIGALHGGRQTFVTMKMPDHMTLTTPNGERDITDLYLAVFNHHDGNGALKATISPVRVVCANTQAMAERQAVSHVSIRHTGNFEVKLSEVRRLLGLTFAFRDTFMAEIEAMAAREIAAVEVFDVISDVFNVDGAENTAQRKRRLDTVSKVMTVYRTDPTVTTWQGTRYGAYNAVTRYLDHVMPVKGNGASQADKRALRTLSSAPLAATKGRAFELLSA